MKFTIKVALALFIFCIPQVFATPFTYEGVTKSPAWPKNSTLTVFIQPDPDYDPQDSNSVNRAELAKTGVERWTKTLSDRMITLVVMIGNVPATNPPANSIPFTWEADGFKSGKLELGDGTGQVDGIGNCGGTTTELNSGSAQLRRALPAGSPGEKEFIKNLAEHEMTHVLGLADDEKGVVTKHGQDQTNRDVDNQNNQQLNDQDKKEINSLYGTAATGGQGKPKGQVTKSGGGVQVNSFTYQFDFIPANLIPQPDDPEHIALITMDIDPALIVNVIPPAGWIPLLQEFPLITDPYFSEGYMIDGAPQPQPWNSNVRRTFIAFRVSEQQSLIDNVPANIDPGLSLDTQSFQIVINTIPGLVEVPIEVWAGDELQLVPGPALQENEIPLLPFGGGAVLFLFLSYIVRAKSNVSL